MPAVLPSLATAPTVPGALSSDDEERCWCCEDNPIYELPQNVGPKVVVGTAVAFKKNGATERDHFSRVRAYREMEAPLGLSNFLAKEDRQIALRVFLLDNSGSTAAPDGHVLMRKGKSYESLCSTRWQEIRAMALEQASWNAKAGVRSEFHLLNPPFPQNPVAGRDFAVVDPLIGNVTCQVAQMEQMLYASGPRGPTSLGGCLKRLRHRFLREVSDGKRIMLSIVTDGLPTVQKNYQVVDDTQSFIQELRAFAGSLNCFVVIRLATDDDTTVDFYNRIDEELELPLDILDDLNAEAKEVSDSGNGWFAYTPMIHRIREGGSFEKLFDLLDERPFQVPEIATFLEYLLRGPKDDPFPRKPKELLERVEQLLPASPLVYDGLSGKMVPPVNIKKLKKALGQTALSRVKSMPGKALQAVRRLLPLS